MIFFSNKEKDIYLNLLSGRTDQFMLKTVHGASYLYISFLLTFPVELEELEVAMFGTVDVDPEEVEVILQFYFILHSHCDINVFHFALINSSLLFENEKF